MIALRSDLPLLRLPDGSLAAFDPVWLTECLCEAEGSKHGEAWWVAPHVAESVATFLREDYPEPVIELGHLQDLLQFSLRKTGFDTVADALRLPPPPAHVGLAELAIAAGTGYELQFFQLLASQLRDALQKGCRKVEFAGLRPCVKILRGARRWRKDCESLTSEIVHFIRSQADASGVRDLRIELS